MNAQPRPYKVNPDSELARRLSEADRQPVILDNAGVRYRVVREVSEVQMTDDPWAHYDADKIRAAIRASAGALKGVDRDELLADLHAQRGQNSHGRPAE